MYLSRYCNGKHFKSRGHGKSKKIKMQIEGKISEGSGASVIQPRVSPKLIEI